MDASQFSLLSIQSDDRWPFRGSCEGMHSMFFQSHWPRLVIMQSSTCLSRRKFPSFLWGFFLDHWFEQHILLSTFDLSGRVKHVLNSLPSKPQEGLKVWTLAGLYLCKPVEEGRMWMLPILRRYHNLKFSRYDLVKVLQIELCMMETSHHWFILNPIQFYRSDTKAISE